MTEAKSLTWVGLSAQLLPKQYGLKTAGHLQRALRRWESQVVLQRAFAPRWDRLTQNPPYSGPKLNGRANFQQVASASPDCSNFID